MLARCNALSRSKDYKPCDKDEMFPGSGTCRMHGSLNSNVAYKAIRRATMGQVTKINQVVEGSVVFPDNPFDTLNQVLIEVRQWKELIERKIEKMGDEGEDWRFLDKAGAEQTRSEIALLERAQDRMIRAAATLSKLNLEERFVKLSEQQAASIIYIINEVFKRAHLDEAAREHARDLVTVVIKEMLTQTGKKRYI